MRNFDSLLTFLCLHYILLSSYSIELSLLQEKKKKKKTYAFIQFFNGSLKASVLSLRIQATLSYAEFLLTTALNGSVCALRTPPPFFIASSL